MDKIQWGSFSYSEVFQIEPTKELPGIPSMFIHYVTDSGRKMVTIANRLESMTEDKAVGLFSHEGLELALEWVRALDNPHADTHSVSIHNIIDMPLPSSYAVAYHGLPLKFLF